MSVRIFPNQSPSLAHHAAGILKDQVAEKPESVLGLATGSTPESTYELFAGMIRGGLAFNRVTTFNLDEYIGLPHDHPQSYWSFMFQKFFGLTGRYQNFSDFASRVNQPEGRIFIPDGMTEDLDGFCDAYEGWIRRRGGIDLQILGIGEDGHIAFNEPGTDLTSRTHVVALHQSTIQANARFFENEKDVPRTALTMGVQTILDARSILLLATGEAKSNPVHLALEGSVLSEITASALQKHSRVIVLLDEAAARKLKGGH